MSRKNRRKRGQNDAAPPAFLENLTRGAERLARTRWAFPAILVALCIAIYARSFPLGLVDFDDDVYIFEDPRLEALSTPNIGRILGRPFFSNYHPVTTLTYAFDRAVWGRWLPGFRLTHLAFYAGGVVLLYYLFESLLGSAASSGQGCRPDRAWGAFVAAAVYATHAIHVEPVAWLAQRKDVVCLVFYVSSILAYIRYSQRQGGSAAPATPRQHGRQEMLPSGRASAEPPPRSAHGGAEPNVRGGERRRWFYAASVGLATLACLSKGYAVVLPAVLLAYDLCFAEGLGPRRPDSVVDPTGQRRLSRKIVDKLPYVAVSAAVAAFTILAQGKESALVESAYTAWDKLVMLCKVFAVYAGKTVLPVRLSALYLVGARWPPAWTAPLGFALAAGAVAGFVLLRRRQPAAAFGIALYVLPLGTVMNVFFTLRVWIADRYLFFPTMGSSVALAAAGLWLYRRTSDHRRRTGAPTSVAKASRRATGWVLGLSAAFVVALYSALAVARIPAWHDPISLWSDALRKHAGVGGSGPVVAGELARTDARRLNRQLITILAQAYGRRGDVAEAEALLVGLKVDPAVPGQDVETNGDLAFAQIAMGKGRYDEAIRLARRAAEGGTWKAPKGWALVGCAHAQKGEYEAAKGALLESLRLYRESGRAGGPDAANVMHDIGLVELKQGNLEEAAEWFGRSREAAPKDHRAALGLAMSYERMGRLAEARAAYEEVLRRAPEHPERKVIAATIERLRKAVEAQEPEP